MAERYGVFTSSGAAPGDRAYTSANIAEMWNLLSWNVSGVVRGYLNDYAVTNANTTTSAVNTGGAVKTGYFHINYSSTNATHGAVTAGYKRIDRIVLRVDTASTRTMAITVIAGSETTGTPSPPAVTAATDVKIAQVLLNRAAGGAYTCTVTMERDCIPTVSATAEGTGITGNLVGNVMGDVTGIHVGNTTGILTGSVRRTSSEYWSTTRTQDNLFLIISPFIPTTGNFCPLSGGAVWNSGVNYVSYILHQAYRSSSTAIQITYTKHWGDGTSITMSSITCNSGSSSAAWSSENPATGYVFIGG